MGGQNEYDPHFLTRSYNKLPNNLLQEKRHEILEAVLPNLRDLSISGGLQSIMKPGVLFRSARTFAQSRKVVKLVFCDMLNIVSVIDLRDDDLSKSPNEDFSRAVVAQAYSLNLSVLPTLCSSNAKPSEIHHTINNFSPSFFFSLTQNQNITQESHSPSSNVLSRHQYTPSSGFKENTTRPCRRTSIKAVHGISPSHTIPDSSKCRSSRRHLYIVNILNSPKVRARVEETVLSSFTLPLFVVYKLTDKLTGSSLAPYYFCKYFISHQDILDSYIEMFNCCGENICKVLKLITLVDIPILLHCTLGKDRTGIISMLLLSVLGATEENIVNDYVLTECTQECFTKYKYNFIINESGLNEKFVYAHPSTCRGCLVFLHTSWGSVDGYLDAIGFDNGWRCALRKKFLLST